MDGLDTNLFYAIHSLAGKSPSLDVLIIFLAEYLIYLVLAFFAYRALRAYLSRQDWKELLPYASAVLCALVARFAVGSGIRHFYHHLRPFQVLPIRHLLTDTAYSFPSGHTVFMFGLATAVFFFDKRLAYILYAAGLIIGIARIAAGVHYPSDIVGGAVLGALTSCVLYIAYKKSPLYL